MTPTVIPMNPKLWIVLACVALSGCGGKAQSQVRFGVFGNYDVLRPLLTVAAEAADWRIELRGTAIGTDAEPERTDPYVTPDHGTLRVAVVLARPGEAPLAADTLSLDIRRDWRWGVDVWLVDHNPTDACFGCKGSRAIAVPDSLVPGVADSLYIVWGGNFISHPVVY